MSQPAPMTELSSSRISDISLLRGSPVQGQPFSFPGGDVTIKVKFEGEILTGKVMHRNRKYVPTNFQSSIQFMMKVALLCEQYDCVGIVKPWLRDWCTVIQSKNGLGQTLGDIERATNELRVGENYLYSWIWVVFSQLLPDKLIGSVHTCREATIQRLLNIVYHQLERYSKYDKHGDYVLSEYNDCSSEYCKAIIYGSLLMELEKCGLWPKKTVRDLTQSVEDIASRIRDIDVLYLGRDDDEDEDQSSKEDDHSKCGVHYIWEVSSILKDIPDPTLECHRRHMELRGGTFGADIRDKADVIEAKEVGMMSPKWAETTPPRAKSSLQPTTKQVARVSLVKKGNQSNLQPPRTPPQLLSDSSNSKSKLTYQA
ncbi:hypothetical protein IFR05_014748 [Cadophora sp. M221]|nr:hypothetical protein IFR05_014748 [Cadophora sp. M221]